ncbi:MAG TPA: iron-containing redox enzyme family protein, partial [Acidimicrobiales bacterium]|nr:iron-containing redox enzyme family protein [Acidimicrobiales bacterium]
PPLPAGDPLRSSDLQVALWCCHELACRGFDGVELDEHDPVLVGFRNVLSGAFEAALRALVPKASGAGGWDADAVAGEVAAAGWDASSLPVWLAGHGDRPEARDYLALRAAGELRPPDPHTLGVPRLGGAAKAALLSVTFDDLGDGSARVARADAFAASAAAVGVDPATLDLAAVPAEALAAVNLPWLLGVERRLRFALCGHLAARTAAGALASGRLAAWAERLGLPGGWFALRAAADPAHDRIVRERLLPALLADDPGCAGEVIFGARALAALECRLASVAVGAWHADRSVLSPASGRRRSLAA